MKVTLIKDVAGLGSGGEDVVVKDGYALNYLFPHKLAAPFGSDTAKNIAITKAKEIKDSQKHLEKLRESANYINGKDYPVEVKMGANGKMYGSVTKSDLAQIIGIDKNKIILDNPIKSAGKYKLTIDFGKSITATINVIIAAK